MPSEDLPGEGRRPRSENVEGGAGEILSPTGPGAAPCKPASLEERQRRKAQQIVGGIGGKPRLRGKLLNAVFVVAVLAAFGLSLPTKGVSQIVFIDVGLLLLSLKFAYHLHTEAKVNHAQFWILTAIEDRLLDAIKELRELRKEFRSSSETRKAERHAENPSREEENPRRED